MLFFFPYPVVRGTRDGEGLNLFIFYFQGGLGAEPPCFSFFLPALLFAERGQQGGFESFYFLFSRGMGADPHAFLFSFPPCCSRNAGNGEGLNLFNFQQGLPRGPRMLFFFSSRPVVRPRTTGRV